MTLRGIKLYRTHSPPPMDIQNEHLRSRRAAIICGMRRFVKELGVVARFVSRFLRDAETDPRAGLDGRGSTPGRSKRFSSTS
jgi:hypothetical protein